VRRARDTDNESFDTRLVVMVPPSLKRAVVKAARRSYETYGAFVRRALVEQLQREVLRAPANTAMMEVMPATQVMPQIEMPIPKVEMPMLRR
jgi:hypothetical protein